jgi:hypothetical protein
MHSKLFGVGGKDVAVHPWMMRIASHGKNTAKSKKQYTFITWCSNEESYLQPPKTNTPGD